jgi:hypothetical protein
MSLERMICVFCVLESTQSMSSDYEYKIPEYSGEPSNRNAFRVEPSNLWCIHVFNCMYPSLTLYVCIQVCYYTQNTHTHAHRKHTHTFTSNLKHTYI